MRTKLTSNISLVTESLGVGLITGLDSNVGAGSRGLVVAVVGPGHPVQQAIDTRQIGALLRMEVGSKEQFHSGSCRPHGRHVKAVTGKRRDKGLVVDLELGWLDAVLGDFLTNLACLASVPPVEVKGDEHVHSVLVGRVVGISELLVGVRVNTDVQCKGVDSVFLGSLHVIIVVISAGAITGDTNLYVLRVS